MRRALDARDAPANTSARSPRRPTRVRSARRPARSARNSARPRESRAECSPVSAATTPASVTVGKSRPFATICVPTSTSPDSSNSRRMRAWSPTRVVVSESIRSDARAPETGAATSSATRSVPMPNLAISSLAARRACVRQRHLGSRSSGSAASRSARWTASETLQRGHCGTCAARAAEHEPRAPAAVHEAARSSRRVPAARRSPAPDGC